MLSMQELKPLVQEARQKVSKRSFDQSFELFLVFKDLDLKKQPLNLNEVVFLPHSSSKRAKVCVIASGDLALRARKAGADHVIDSNELDRLANQKRQIRKIASEYDFFLAEAALMAKVGKVLGQYFGPRGKMPAPIAPNAPIEQLIERYRGATRIRSRNQLSAACKVGDEKMTDDRIVDNSLAVIDTVVKKLPLGFKNIGALGMKLSMSAPATLRLR